MIRKQTLLALVLLAAVVGMAAIGCAPQPSGEAADQDHVTLVLYFAANDGDDLVTEERSVSKGDVTLAENALLELIAGPREQNHLRTLPEESVILSVEIRGEIAFVDLGSETVEHHSGGSLGDRMSIDSIVHTLTELPGITAVQLLLEGEIVEAVFGHIATDAPLTR
jgi:germination protein M